MRIYSATEEQRVRLREQVRDWTRAGLIDAAQSAQFDPELRVDLRRTGTMLRLGLALFTAIVVAAAAGLVFVVLDLRGEGAVGAVAAVMAVACIAAAETLVRRYRLYRHGVEEILAVAAVILCGTSAAMLTATGVGRFEEDVALMAGLAAAAAAAFAVYRRFGYQYAAVGAMACAALIPLPMAVADSVKRLLAAAVLAACFAAARALRRRHGDEFPGDEGANLQAAAFIGVYFAMNLHASSVVFSWTRPGQERWFWWASYVATWGLPVIGLWAGIRERERRMIDAALIAAIATLLTNKLYLDWPLQTWDPMLLGALLVAVAVTVRRWLGSGDGGERHGFTPVRLVESEARTIRLLGLVSIGVQPSREAADVCRRTFGVPGRPFRRGWGRR